MTYKSVYVCDGCSEEGLALRNQGMERDADLPAGWWALSRRDDNTLTFCTLDCLLAWRYRGLGSPQEGERGVDTNQPDTLN